MTTSARHWPALTGGAMPFLQSHDTVRKGRIRPDQLPAITWLHAAHIRVGARPLGVEHLPAPALDRAFLARAFVPMSDGHRATQGRHPAVRWGRTGSCSPVRLPSGAHVVANLVDALKANSSRWIHNTFPPLKVFAWQKGYSAFSVCRRCEHRVIGYIRNQEAHHGPAREGGVDGD